LSFSNLKTFKRNNPSWIPSRIGLKYLERIITTIIGKWYTLALLILFVMCTAGIVLYRIDNHVFLYFGDAVSRIVKSRQFIDSQRPGISNIGTVWLPLPQLLLIPFVSINGLFFSGIAGAMVGIPCLMGTGLLLFAIIRRITGSRPIAFLGACLFTLNPNVIYMALTPMSEPSFFFFVTLGGYALLRWLESDSMKWLLLCAVSVMLATLCRYETWILAPFVVLVAASRGVRTWKESKRLSVGRIAATTAITFAGIAFWFIWNAAQYGDPLKFMHWSASIAASSSSSSFQYPLHDDIVLFGRAILTIFGPVLLLITGVMFISFRHKPAAWKQILLLSFLVLPTLFVLFALLTGNVQIDQWWWNWRYVLILGLFLSVAGAMGLSELFRRVRSMLLRVSVVVGLLAMPFVQIAIPAVGVATFNDAAKSLHDTTPYATALGERLSSIDNKSSIALLTGYGQAQRIMISSGLPLNRFHIICYPDKKDSLESLSASDRYVVIENGLTLKSRELVDDWLSRGASQLRDYETVQEDSHFTFMEQKEIFALKETK
jgi:hypothetical protein